MQFSEVLEDRDRVPSWNGNEVAIIGMAGRFPRASSIEAFWQNIRDGVESVTFFSAEELLAAGVPAVTLEKPHYVRANVTLEDIDQFDAPFFGISPWEAKILDPQQRLFLECSWQALEHAGYDPYTYEQPIGVFASTGSSTYLIYNLLRNREVSEGIEMARLLFANEKDFLATRVSYKLNLRGPSMVIQTACSSSLVAVHVACQSLLSGECDIALAGGVSVNAQQKRGYFYQSDAYFSPDGHCRAFDARAQGTISGSGLGVVVLKRLEDALRDRDSIAAIIRGSACNNDGKVKAGYTAPGVQGQAAVIADALQVAGIDPETIGYIETHGTGTPIGDPIEVTALRQVYEAETDKKGFCAIGSLKTNVGHMDTAAGIGGLIKTILALQHGYLPPHLHFTEPSPRIDFASSPFYVNTTLKEWTRGATPRRAGVSAFGVGGTNAHIVLEEADSGAPPLEQASHLWQLLPLSARTQTGLALAQQSLATFLQNHPALPLSDVAFTLQVGRHAFAHRCVLVSQKTSETSQLLQNVTPDRILSAYYGGATRSVVFLFPGGGAQYINMGRELYEREPVFRAEIEHCVAILKTHLSYDLLSLLYPSPEQEQQSAERFGQSFVSLPVLFVTEYALARLWENWGVQPQAMIGHSLGEYVAACIAGVFSLEDALALVAFREKLAEQLPRGAMLSVLLAEHELVPLLDEHLSIALVNSPTQCVISGPLEAVDALERLLVARQVQCRRVNVSVAGHSAQLEPALGTVADFLQKIPLQAPRIPFISNLTGSWITAEEATDPSYWVRQLRYTVRFSDGIQELLKKQGRIFLEVGPGQALSRLTKQIIAHQSSAVLQERTEYPPILASMRRTQDKMSDIQHFLTTAGQLWLAGMPLNWDRLHSGDACRRIPLPTYPFERERYWIEPDVLVAFASNEVQAAAEDVTKVERETTEPLQSHAPSSHARPNVSTPHRTPTNEIERSIAVVWQETLGIHDIGIDDNFFELGGDSLIGLKLVARLRDIFMVDIPLQVCFESPTIAQLAEAIELLFIEQIENLPADSVQAFLTRTGDVSQ